MRRFRLSRTNLFAGRTAHTDDELDEIPTKCARRAEAERAAEASVKPQAMRPSRARIALWGQDGARQSTSFLAQIVRQGIVDVGSCDSGVAGADGDLVKVGHHVTDSVQSLHRRLLMGIDFQASDIIVTRAE